MQTRRLVLTGTLGLAGISLAALTLNSRADDKPAAAPPLQTVTVAPVPEREISEWDEFTGRLEAVDQVEIRPRVSG
jgi:multidrug efflux pump subunit AcrA (membrane-fusion protein)